MPSVNLWTAEETLPSRLSIGFALCVMLGVLVLGGLGWRGLSSRRQLRETARPAILKQPIHFVKRTFDPANPPPDTGIEPT